MKYNIGDRVILVSKEYKDSKSNPRWCGEFGEIQGTITDGIYHHQLVPDPNFQCHVKWDIIDHHENTHNCYKSSDIRLTTSLSILPEELFTL